MNITNPAHFPAQALKSVWHKYIFYAKAPVFTIGLWWQYTVVGIKYYLTELKF